MGTLSPPTKCYITGLKTQEYNSNNHLIEYFIEINKNKILLKFPADYIISEFINENKHIIYGLFLNDKFPALYGKTNSPILDNKILEKIIIESTVPKLPKEKINNLLIKLHSLQKYEGAMIYLPEESGRLTLANKLYFKNYQELVFYLNTLKEQGFIEGLDVSSMAGKDITNIKLTFLGLTRVLEISESGNLSNNCFIAMSFSEELNETRKAIKDTVRETGFFPILIDEIQIESDVTINDAIIAQIKNCKFLVADFTQQKHGVYFEAGFGLGLKKPVIYLCNEDDFDNSHFDTKHYPHIIYNDMSELKNKLKLKIEAWIK